jgi:glutathione S-transferase
MDPTPKLYVILGSHACRTGMLLLEHKGISYERVELPTGLHPFALRLHGFPAKPGPPRTAGQRRTVALALGDRMGTVPALRINGERVQTNRKIAGYLDRTQPEPPLYPADPERRRAVEEAEGWGDETFQMTARRLAAAALTHGPDAIHARGRDGRLGPLLWRHDTSRRIGTRWVARIFAANRKTEPELLASLPAMLDRIDAWIDAGVLNGAALNAADYMIVTSLGLLSYRRDLSETLESRPLGELVDRVLPLPA